LRNRVGWEPPGGTRVVCAQVHRKKRSSIPPSSSKSVRSPQKGHSKLDPQAACSGWNFQRGEIRSPGRSKENVMIGWRGEGAKNSSMVKIMKRKGTVLVPDLLVCPGRWLAQKIRRRIPRLIHRRRGKIPPANTRRPPSPGKNTQMASAGTGRRRQRSSPRRLPPKTRRQPAQPCKVTGEGKSGRRDWSPRVDNEIITTSNAGEGGRVRPPWTDAQQECSGRLHSRKQLQVAVGRTRQKFALARLDRTSPLPGPAAARTWHQNVEGRDVVNSSTRSVIQNKLDSMEKTWKAAVTQRRA